MPTSNTRLQGLNRTLFNPGQRVACALSGGADSTALLLALLEANAEKESLGIVLTAVHIHHGLRGDEADADEAFGRDLCNRLSVPLTVEHVDTLTRQQTEGEGVEEAARELRYSVFRRLLTTGQTDAVATAHTLDDQAETVLMKLLRGAWTEGLGGISPVLNLTGLKDPAHHTAAKPNSDPQILRPMLAVSRAEVERFLQQRNQPWRHDSSNDDLRLTRNRIRHDLMPILRSFNPALAETLARTAEIAREDHAYWEAETARALPGLLLPGKPVRGGGRAVSTGPGEQSFAIEIDRLRPHPPALRRRILRAAALRLGCRLNADETAKLLALAGLATYPGLSARNGARLELGSGLRAERSVRELRFSKEPLLRIPKKV